MVVYISVMNDLYIFTQIARHLQDLDPIRLVNHDLNELSRSFLRDLILRKYNLDVSQAREDMLSINRMSCSHPGVVLSLAINRNHLIIANYLYNIRIKIGNIDHIFSTLKHCDAAVWLYQRYPKHFLHSWRHRVNRINSVAWLDRLDQVGAIPCQYIINRYFTGNYHIDILEWLLNKGYNPSSLNK